MALRFANRVALITGGGSGIGATCARRSVAEGAKLLVTDIKVEVGETIAAETGGLFVR